jgi:glycosyltransferase involved in cell wall biosynthesis
MARHTSPSVTVVVCTRNRSTALRDAGEAALALETALGWEMLIVDNGSTDDTVEVARAIAATDPRRVRVVVEPELGLSAARNLGVRQARGDLVIFLDDDAVPEPGWLDAYCAVFAETDALAAGGPVEPDFAAPPPAFFGAEFLPYVSAWDRGTERHELTYSEYPRGANMGFRRAAFERFGTFDRRLGRRGRSLRSCEEIELCLRIERGGGRVVYEPGARVCHRVEGDRLSVEWLLARFAAQGFSEAIVEWKHDGLAGLAAGVRRLRHAVGFHAGRSGPDALLTRGHRRALAAYRRGALYAVVVVPRWRPPAGRSAG